MTTHETVEALLTQLIKNAHTLKEVKEPLVEWYKHMRLESDSLLSEGLNALHGGFYANSAGQAFIYGYEIAIQRMTGLNTQEHLAAFCVTENKSTHPKNMQTSLSEVAGQFALTGRKDFVTMASDAKWLLVAATSGVSDEGVNQIKLVKVDVSLPGVNVQTLPPLPFISDVSHGAVSFDAVLVNSENVYSGDGYANFVKPFRWFEDINVFVSLSGYLLKLALTNQWPVESKVEIISILVTLINIQCMGPDEPMAHIIMFDQAARLECWLDRYDSAWDHVNPVVARAWKRDRGILKVADYARSVRYKKALSRMGIT